MQNSVAPSSWAERAASQHLGRRSAAAAGGRGSRTPTTASRTSSPRGSRRSCPTRSTPARPRREVQATRTRWASSSMASSTVPPGRSGVGRWSSTSTSASAYTISGSSSARSSSRRRAQASSSAAGSASQAATASSSRGGVDTAAADMGTPGTGDEVGTRGRRRLRAGRLDRKAGQASSAATPRSSCQSNVSGPSRGRWGSTASRRPPERRSSSSRLVRVARSGFAG